MKKYLIILSLLVTAFLLSAQSVSNVRVEQDPELRYYKITFDLSGEANEQYQIRVAPYKEGKELTQLSFLSGQGITQPCNPGKDLKVFWAPDLEGYETNGWQFRVSANEIIKNLVFVEGGTFRMGSNDGQDDEKPVHEVSVSSFYIGKYEVTQKEWKEVMGSNPSYFKGDESPVEKVNWYDAVEFCNKLSLREGLTPCYSISGKNISCDWGTNGYRLPTEAEWEYAARGGNKSKGYKYSGSNDLGAMAWYNDNSGSQTHSVGRKQPNELGLYDMSGNVWEWCWDWYDDDYYGRSPDSDPKGTGPGSTRVLRGGSWFNYGDNYCRVVFRNNSNPDGRLNNYGFRVVRAKL